MTDWFNQKPFVVTEEELPGTWGGYRDGRLFRCHLCGVFFQLGDTARFVLANFPGSKARFGNFFVCQQCDGPDVLDRAAKHEKEMLRLAWWMQDSERLENHPDYPRDRNRQV